MEKLRLNLGCGSKRLPGYINVDQFGNPDLKFNLETFPWPWDDHSVIEIQLIHVLEHLGQQTNVYLKIIQEMYRVCADGALIHIVVPHHRHDNFVHDPTHVRAITPMGLRMFSRRANEEWQAQGCANTLLAFYLNVDFALVRTQFVPSQLWRDRYPDHVSDLELLMRESKLYNNLIEEVDMVLKVIKPGTEFSEKESHSDQELIASSSVLAPENLTDSVPVSEANQAAQAELKLGNRCYHQGKVTEAIAHYQNSVKLAPNLYLARYNLAVMLGDCERWQEAIEELQHLVNFKPNSAKGYNRLGFSYSQINQLEAAIDAYRQAIALNPNFAQAHFNLGMSLLKSGELVEGFAECEWRWQTKEFTQFNCPHPQWRGEDISDKTLLVHTEQGAGDAIQFIRFIPVVKQRCKRLLVCCPEHLQLLFSQIPEIDQILGAGKFSPSTFDTYIPLMSLPHVLGTTLERIPQNIPYFRVAPSQFLLPNASATHRKIGIVWAGSPTHTNDRHRSCNLADLIPILEQQNCQFYSLQKGERVADLDQLPPSIQVEDLSSKLQDYTDTAAAINQLDLVISVDTSVAHLTGALGKPIWTLLCYSADWRWLLDRDDTPWYPTMRLFRQPQPGDWASVCQQVVLALSSEFDITD